MLTQYNFQLIKESRPHFLINLFSRFSFFFLKDINLNTVLK